MVINEIDDIEVWFKYARADLSMARILLDQGDADMYWGITFHCQQAAEKAIKTYLVHKEIPFSTSHDIGKLAFDVLKFHPELEPLMRKASRLSKYAVFYRYPKPKAAAEITVSQLNEALACAQDVIDQMSALMPLK